jgi:4-diphosphocytidyl-2-C-methyl-D-erythritol kinase
VTARAPGKVNLSLRVGPVTADGYHPLVTVFQAVSLIEEVTVTQAPTGAGISITVVGPGSDTVPTDSTNIVWKAAELIAMHAGVAPDVEIQIVKGVPVAGGMAGGSADGAAALVACNALWEAGASDDSLHAYAMRLGADVPFCLLGGTAIGVGRGDRVSPVMTRGQFHWVFGTQADGLSTPAVFRAFDGIDASGRPPFEAAPGDQDVSLLHALRGGDAVELGESLLNELQPATFVLRPELRKVLEVAAEGNALGCIVSGSGPTVAALAKSESHAVAIGARWIAADVVQSVHIATGPVPGARVVPPSQAHPPTIA